MRTAFGKLDRRAKGFIDEKDIWALLEGKKPTQEVVDSMLFEADQDKDLQVSF